LSVRWIVFDAVGTVIEPVPDVATVYHAIGARHGSRLSRTEVSDRFRSAFQADESADRATNRLTTDEFLERDRWRRIVNTVLDDVEDPDSCFQDLFDHFGRPGSWQCFDDVTDTLTEFASRGYRLAVASNFDRRLHAICDELGALPLLEVRIISAEVEWRKPARQFYRAVIDRLSAPADSILVVGDDEVNDVDGARSAGMRAIHLDRKSATHHRAQPSGDSPISSLTELLERLS
jgi:putative hydrolase of the HAD superfamily